MTSDSVLSRCETARPRRRPLGFASSSSWNCTASYIGGNSDLVLEDPVGGCCSRVPSTKKVLRPNAMEIDDALIERARNDAEGNK
jgi:hypothetical protein